MQTRRESLNKFYRTGAKNLHFSQTLFTVPYTPLYKRSPLNTVGNACFGNPAKSTPVKESIAVRRVTRRDRDSLAGSENFKIRSKSIGLAPEQSRDTKDSW